MFVRALDYAQVFLIFFNANHRTDQLWFMIADSVVMLISAKWSVQKDTSFQYKIIFVFLFYNKLDDSTDPPTGIQLQPIFTGTQKNHDGDSQGTNRFTGTDR